ncbi:hypothetical protein E4T85_21605 [Bacillus stratosphericus]|nr:hypothetical protein E4T85_21605 [Bacillus stratosphericus]
MAKLLYFWRQAAQKRFCLPLCLRAEALFSGWGGNEADWACRSANPAFALYQRPSEKACPPPPAVL